MFNEKSDYKQNEFVIGIMRKLLIKLLDNGYLMTNNFHQLIYKIFNDTPFRLKQSFHTYYNVRYDY